MKGKIGKLNFTKTKICFAKYIVKRMKQQVIDWEKYLQNTSGKGFVSKIYKELLKFNNK